MIVTIDGLSGCKKTPTAAEFARRTGFYHLNSGVIYRSLVGLIVMVGYFPASKSEWSETAEYIRENIYMDYETATLRNGATGEDSPFSCCKTYYKGGDAKRDYLKTSRSIFSPVTGDEASQLASIRRVRIFATQVQRELAKGRNIVVDGRDAGSVVFPKADYKFWFYADPSSRAEWKYKYEFSGPAKRDKKEEAKIINNIADDFMKRDTREVERLVAPLEVVEDAVKLSVKGKPVESLASEIIRIITKDDQLFKTV